MKEKAVSVIELPSAPDTTVLPDATLVAEVRRALTVLLPSMTVDGGGARILHADRARVVVELVGSCIFCPSRAKSAKALDRGLRERVPAIGELRIVTCGHQGGEVVSHTSA